MKKLLGIVAVFLLVYIVIKMGGKEIEAEIEKEDEIENQINVISQEIDTKVFFYKGKLIDSNILIVKETTDLNNQDFDIFKNTFDFEHNTYLIINCKDKDVSEVLTEEISEEGISFKLLFTETKDFENSVLIEIQNLKITNLNLINLNWEEY